MSTSKDEIREKVEFAKECDSNPNEVAMTIGGASASDPLYVREIVWQWPKEFLEGLDGNTRDVFSQLLALQEYDDDEVKPTSYAFTFVWNLLLPTAKQLVHGLPKCAIYTDDLGGIRCEWKQSRRHVRLIVPAWGHGNHCIYHEEGDQYAAEDAVTTDMLATWLRWITEDDAAGR